MKVACIILTNRKTKKVYEKNYSMLSKMSIESKYNIDLYTYYNDETTNYRIENNTIYFSYKTLQDKFDYHHTFLNSLLYIGNTVLTLFDLYTNHQNEYDSYIFYEDDIAYTNDKNLFDTIFDNFTEDSYDMIFQSPRIINDNWSWNNIHSRNCSFNSYSGLLNIYVIKPYIINALIQYINKGYYAHHEYLVNGFVLHNNYKVKYLSDVLSIFSIYTKIDKLDKMYDIIHPIKKLKDLKYVKASINKPFRTCIMTMAKNERLDIKEWVDYHLHLGFDAIYIYEDYGSESHADIFENYDNVFIFKVADTNIKNYQTCETQIKLFHYFLKKVKDEKIYDWCLFTDIDEFLYLDNTTLQELCFNYQAYNGLLLSWKMYNANGHINRPEGNIVDNYTETTDIILDGNDNITQWAKKSFVNINKASKFDTNHCIRGGVDIEESHNFNNKLIYHTAWINHYFTKSWEDFCYRMETRGNMSNNNRSYDQFFKVNQKLIFLKKDLIFKQRYKHNNNVHFISHEYKLISGGNLDDINQLNLRK